MPLDVNVTSAGEGLRSIPLVEIGAAGAPGLAEAAPDLLAEIVGMARGRYGRLALGVGDAVARRWLENADNPYLDEIGAVADHLGQPGAYMLNLSYEWSCTTGVGPDPSGEGSRLLRTLDWPLDGLGRTLMVARQRGAVGDFYNISWPGFSGITTALAPGRFGAALNQPPARSTYPLMAIDWVVNRVGVWRHRGLPPTHLLRRVFDQCRDYAEAKEMLCGTPLCLPVFFILSGMGPGEGCVIERLEESAKVREAPASAANHWLAQRVPGRPRGQDSIGRWRLMEERRDSQPDDFSWVVPPIRNYATRVAAILNAARGRLLVQGWESSGPVTRVFRL